MFRNCFPKSRKKTQQQLQLWGVLLNLCIYCRVRWFVVLKGYFSLIKMDNLVKARRINTESQAYHIQSQYWEGMGFDFWRRMGCLLNLLVWANFLNFPEFQANSLLTNLICINIFRSIFRSHITPICPFSICMMESQSLGKPISRIKIHWSEDVLFLQSSILWH